MKFSGESVKTPRGKFFAKWLTECAGSGGVSRSIRGVQIGLLDIVDLEELLLRDLADLVEDEDVERKLIDSVLRNAGHQVLLAGNGAFFFKQLVAVAASSVWAFAFTYGMLWLIDRVTPVHVTAETEDAGLDQGLHGEIAYEGA